MCGNLSSCTGEIYIIIPTQYPPSKEKVMCVEMAYCTNCGKEIASNSKFCSACGKENAEYKHDTRFVRILIIFLILLFALCAFLSVQVYYKFIFLITPGVMISPYLCAFINDKTDRKYKPNEDRSVKRSKKFKETQNGRLPYKK